MTALPGGTQINIQTASAPVLLTLAPNVNIDHAKALAELRDKTPIVSMEKFSELEIVKNNQIPSEKVTLISKYFLIEAKVTIEKQSLVLYTLVERTLDEKEKKVIIRIVWQSKGIW